MKKSGCGCNSKLLPILLIAILLFTLIASSPILNFLVNPREYFQNEESEPKLTLYYTDWCPASQAFLKTWEELKSLNLAPLRQVECSESKNKQECKDINTVPTLKYKQNGEVKVYDGPRDLESLKNHLASL